MFYYEGYRNIILSFDTFQLQKTLIKKDESDCGFDIYGAVQCGIVQCSIVHYITVQCHVIQYIIVQWRAANAVQCNSGHCNIVQ